MFRALTCVALVLVLGCGHGLIVVNAGVANKSAAGLAAPLTPEAYCLALTSANISFKAPSITREQSDFCHQVLAPPGGKL